MIRRIPVFATLVVLIAVGIMIALGFWQLRRMHEKEALLTRYAAAQVDTAEVEWPRDPARAQALLYRRARLTCARVTGHSSMAGRSVCDELGLAQTVDCELAGGGKALVVLGWSPQPNAGLAWNGGEVRGHIAPGPRLIADPPLDGLAPVAKPDPAEIPNNHFSYAIQWFLFAAVALVIYTIALRKRMVRT
jgi:surfeit locus 1 family protein